MKYKNLIIILILFSFINKIKNDCPPKLGVDYPGIKCGKDNPKDEKDCTKYGTDSGMLCCYVKYSDNTKNCTLLSIDKAKEEACKINDFRDFGSE